MISIHSKRDGFRRISLHRALVAFLMLALLCLPRTALAQTVPTTEAEADADPAYYPLRLGSGSFSQFAKWTVPDTGIPFQYSGNAICQDNLATCAMTVTAGQVKAALEAGAEEWNNAILTGGLIAAHSGNFFQDCSGATCNFSSYQPIVPTAAKIIGSGDNNGNSDVDATSNPGNRTCVFPAYHVNPDGSFKEFVLYTAFDAATGQPASWTSVGTMLGDAALATQLCTEQVVHTVDIPNSRFIPTRNANGSLKTGGDGRNHFFAEQNDFGDATGGLAGTNTLAITLTSGFLYPGCSTGEITEADILLNADFNSSVIDHWEITNNYVNAALPLTDECAIEAQNADNTTNDVDGSANWLCYEGEAAIYTMGLKSIFDVEDVTTHELGHFVGLDHPCARYNQDGPATTCTIAAESPANKQTKISVATMYWNAKPGQTNKRSIEPSDEDGLAAAFGLIYICGSSGGGGCEMNASAHSSWRSAALAAIALPFFFFFVRRRRSRAALQVNHMPRPRARRGKDHLPAILLAAGILFAAASAQATTVRTVSVSNLVKTSKYVSEVRVTGKEGVYLSNGQIATKYRVETLDSVKGKAVSEFYVPGGVVGQRFQIIAGARHFDEGDELILFGNETRDGKITPAEIMQGTQQVRVNAETGTREVETGMPPAGSVVSVEENGQMSARRAEGPEELPPTMNVDDYKTYLRGLAKQ